MIELFMEIGKCIADLAVIHEPAHLPIALARNHHVNPVPVSMKLRFRTSTGRCMGGLEVKRFDQLDFHSTVSEI